MTKGPPQNANCSFWNGLLGYGPTWRQNLLCFFPAAVGLASLDVMSNFLCMWWSCVAWICMCIHICVEAVSCTTHALSKLEMSITGLECPPADISSSVKRINNVCCMFNYRLSSAAKPLFTVHSSRSGRFEGWLGTESKDAPEWSLHVEPVISWSFFSITTFISVALSSPQSCNCTYFFFF